jgi:hypothetical protein
MARPPRQPGERAMDARMWLGVVTTGPNMALAALLTGRPGWLASAAGGYLEASMPPPSEPYGIFPRLVAVTAALLQLPRGGRLRGWPEASWR